VSKRAFLLFFLAMLLLPGPLLLWQRHRLERMPARQEVEEALLARAPGLGLTLVDRSRPGGCPGSLPLLGQLLGGRYADFAWFEFRRGEQDLVVWLAGDGARVSGLRVSTETGDRAMLEAELAWMGELAPALRARVHPDWRQGPPTASPPRFGMGL